MSLSVEREALEREWQQAWKQTSCGKKMSANLFFILKDLDQELKALEESAKQRVSRTKVRKTKWYNKNDETF